MTETKTYATREDWKAACAARYRDRAGCSPEAAARLAAETLCSALGIEDIEDDTTVPFADPAEEADEDMSYWED